MSLRVHNITLALLVFSLLLSACETSSNPTNKTVPSGVIPISLTTIEGLTEDIIDFVPNGDWSKVNSDISAIDKAWATYQPQAVKDGATQATQDLFSESMSSLKSAATSQDAIETMQAANNLSTAVIDMFDLYNPAIPTDIGRLDVLERQVILDTANQNFAAAGNTLAKINSVWERVKPSVLEHNGQSVGEQFDNSLAIQISAQKSKDSKRITDEARKGLEIVDTLENLY